MQNFVFYLKWVLIESIQHWNGNLGYSWKQTEILESCFKDGINKDSEKKKEK